MNGFSAVGTKKLWIGSARKCASTTLHKLQEKNSLNIKNFRENDMKEDVKFVVVVRNVWQRWRSGMMTDCPYHSNEYQNFDLNNKNFVEHEELFLEMEDPKRYEWEGKYSFKPFIDSIIKYHAPECDLSWMWNKRHTRFWEWNNSSLNSLKELCKRKNVYFVEISKLNTRAFREWCISQEEGWKSVETIKTSNTSASVGYYNFWKLYKHRGVLRNLALVNPVIDLPTNEKRDEVMFYRNLAIKEQTFLNEIKNTNKNYLDLK